MPTLLPAQREWHQKALAVREEKDIPFLGLFKERQDGAGAFLRQYCVREYINMTDEDILYIPQDDKSPEASDTAYFDFGYENAHAEQLDSFALLRPTAALPKTCTLNATPDLPHYATSWIFRPISVLP